MRINVTIKEYFVCEFKDKAPKYTHLVSTYITC